MPPTDKYNEILVGIVAGMAIFLVITSMLVFILLFYQKKKFQHKNQLATMEKNLSELLLKSQIEIQKTILDQISGELHDNVGQILSLAKVQVNLIQEKGECSLMLLDDVKDNIGKALTDLRDVAKSLNSERLKNLSLHEAITIELERFSKMGTLLIQFDALGEERNINDQNKFIAFRVVQECLQNIIKHAAASEINVRFSYLEDNFRLDIADNGKGFDYEFVLGNNDGIGLKNLQSRVSLTGGTCDILSSPGKGSVIIISIPYE